LFFRFSRRRALYRYANWTYGNLRTLDRRIGAEILKAYRSGEFPGKTQNLFGVGAR